MTATRHSRHRRLEALARVVCGTACLWASGWPARAEDDLAIPDVPAEVQQSPGSSQIGLGGMFDQALRQMIVGGPSPVGDDAAPAMMLAALRKIGDSRLAMIAAACDLSPDQRQRLTVLRNLDGYVCQGAFVYSDPIAWPRVESTDFLFAPAR